MANPSSIPPSEKSAQTFLSKRLDQLKKKITSLQNIKSRKLTLKRLGYRTFKQGADKYVTALKGQSTQETPQSKAGKWVIYFPVRN